MPSGSVLQAQYVVDTQTQTQATTANSSAFVDMAGMTVDITPKYSTSKILIMYNWHVYVMGGSGSWISTDVQLVRTVGGSATNLIGENPVYGTGHHNSGGDNAFLLYQGKQYVDSPSTTSAITYKVQCKVTQNTLTMYYNDGGNGTGGSMVVMEIAV